MINPEELELCKRRGHNTGVGLGKDWAQCKFCGIWLRQVVEEREDEPPTADLDPMVRLSRMNQAMARRLQKPKAKRKAQ